MIDKAAQLLLRQYRFSTGSPLLPPVARAKQCITTFHHGLVSPSAWCRASSSVLLLLAALVANPHSAGVEPAPLVAPVSASTAVAAPVRETAPVVAAAPLQIGETTLDADLAKLVVVYRTFELDERRPPEPMVLAQAERDGAAVLNDDELSDVMAGEFKMNMNNFDVRIQDNQAGQFNFDIAQNAFHGAQGVFTTLQTVNSAVDLTVIVNIYLGQQP